MTQLHIGGASTASVLVTVTVIFFLIFAVSFAFGDVPTGQRRFSREWIAAWARTSAPRLAIAGLFAAAVFATSSMFGGSEDNGASAAGCDEGVPPLSGKAVTDARILGAMEGMSRIAEAAENDDIGEAQSLFFTLDAHNLTHDVDAPLRSINPALARDLCLRVIVLENQMAETLDGEVIAREAAAIAVLLDEARAEIAKAPSPTGISSSDPCEGPIGAVTDHPLTADRINGVILAYQDLTRRAPEAAQGELQEVFAGDAHNLSHDIDGPLREVDPALAVDLCNSVLVLEREFAGDFSRDLIAIEAEKTARILEEAGQAMGILE
jgi:hypothetical protein